jgi:hypothetical protein
MDRLVPEPDRERPFGNGSGHDFGRWHWHAASQGLNHRPGEPLGRPKVSSEPLKPTMTVMSIGLRPPAAVGLAGGQFGENFLKRIDRRGSARAVDPHRPSESLI